jgi:hypothetical protein
VIRAPVLVVLHREGLRADGAPQWLRVADAIELRADAEARGWDSEVARRARVIASLQRHLNRLTNTTSTSTRA